MRRAVVAQLGASPHRRRWPAAVYIISGADIRPPTQGGSVFLPSVQPSHKSGPGVPLCRLESVSSDRGGGGAPEGRQPTPARRFRADEWNARTQHTRVYPSPRPLAAGWGGASEQSCPRKARWRA
ncbi:unnamed protein product [Lampetra planeri]